MPQFLEPALIAGIRVGANHKSLELYEKKDSLFRENPFVTNDSYAYIKFRLLISGYYAQHDLKQIILPFVKNTRDIQTLNFVFVFEFIYLFNHGIKKLAIS